MPVPVQALAQALALRMLILSRTRMTTLTVTVRRRVPACRPALSCRLRGLPEGNAGRAGILVTRTVTTITLTANLPDHRCHLCRHRPADLHAQAVVSRKASTATMMMMATTVKMMPLPMQEVLLVLLVMALVKAQLSGSPA